VHVVAWRDSTPLSDSTVWCTSMHMARAPSQAYRSAKCCCRNITHWDAYLNMLAPCGQLMHAHVQTTGQIGTSPCHGGGTQLQTVSSVYHVRVAPCMWRVFQVTPRCGSPYTIRSILHTSPPPSMWCITCTHHCCCSCAILPFLARRGLSCATIQYHVPDRHVVCAWLWGIPTAQRCNPVI
jgi:hypothetical protein